MSNDFDCDDCGEIIPAYNSEVYTVNSGDDFVCEDCFMTKYDATTSYRGE